MEKRDPYHHKERWEEWKLKNANGVIGVSKKNSELILEFLRDMELGKNTSPKSARGERSFIRLNTLRDKLVFFCKKFNKDLNKITEDEIHLLFSSMRNGKILKKNGEVYKGTGHYVKDFKTFWNWMRRTNKVKKDITEYLSKKEAKPAWVYLTEEQFKKLVNSANSTYRALIIFMYDASCRVTEAYSVKVKDFSENYTKLAIRDEVSKTFGRTIKLKLCSSLVKEHIELNDLTSEDYLFTKKIKDKKKPIHPTAFNKYLRALAKNLFGDKESPAREKYSKFTLYDIRHNASCYWLKRYPQTRGLLYRLGWKKEDEVSYYSEFLGLSDQISDEDMLTTEEKTQLQKEIDKLKRKNDLLTEGYKAIKEKVALIESSFKNKILVQN
jgi:integrase